MKKFFSLFLAALVSVGMMANSYWYRGGDNSWGATAMTVSEDALYEYIQSSNNANQFKIAKSADGWDYNYSYVQAGFNNTDVTGIGDYGQDNCYCWQSGAYYILVYYPNTVVNATSKPIICASTTLPKYEAPAQVEDVTLYFVNDDAWETVRAYVWYGSNGYKTWPGEEATKTAEKANGKDIYSYTFPENYTKIIFNNRTGDEGPQTADLTWDKAKPYYSLAQNQWYATAAEIPAVVVPAKFYITGSAALVGEGLAWNATAVKVTEDNYTFENLAAGDYQLKVLPTGDWSGAIKGYDELTEKTNGLTADNDRNICFRLLAAGDVTVTYTETKFTVEGAFFYLPDGFYLIGQNGWDVTNLSATDKFAATAVDGEYTLTATLAVGDQIKPIYVENNAIQTWYGENDYTVDAAHAGEKTVYFRPVYNSEWAIFGGHIYIEANSDGTALDNTAAAVKAVKVIKNGRMLIEKDGKTYTIAGARVR